MTLTAYMAQLAEVAATGERIGRHMVLAMDCSAAGDGAVGTYAVVGYHIDDVGAALNAGTVDKSYIGEGDSTIKTSTVRSFSVTGQRLVGETWQDFCLSHEIKYGVGSAVQRGYVYFDAGTNAGEQGTVTIAVKKDGAGAAGDPTDVEIDLHVNGTPAEYMYTQATPSTPSTP